MTLVALPLLMLALAQPGEDAAHRDDRLQTEALNRRARDAGGAAARPSDRDMAAWREAQADYRQARDDYARDLARWRRQVADCRAGDTDACLPR